MAKLTVQQFISDHLGGASQYDDVNVRLMLQQFVMRATDALDADLMDADMPAYEEMTLRQQGVYNRVAAELVWLQLRAQQAGTDTDDDVWAETLGMLEEAFGPMDSLLGGTARGVATASAMPQVAGVVDREQVEEIIREAVASWALEGQPRPSDGARGPAGPQGAQGPAGPQGPKGDPGDSGTAGLTEAQVDARVQAGVLDEAETGNTDRWPKNKLPADTAYSADIRTDAQIDARVQAGVEDWAEQGNTDDIPAGKLGLAGGHYKGNYRGSTTYMRGDVVALGAAFYIAIFEVSREDPRRSDNWSVISEAGEQLEVLERLPTLSDLSIDNVYVEGDGVYNKASTQRDSATGWTFANYTERGRSYASAGVSFGSGYPTLGTIPAGSRAVFGYLRVQLNGTSVDAWVDKSDVGDTTLLRVSLRRGGNAYFTEFMLDSGLTSTVGGVTYNRYNGQVLGTRLSALPLSTDEVVLESLAYEKVDLGTPTPNSTIDARIAEFARTGATINIPDARLPAVLRGLPNAFGTSGQILQVNSNANALEFADAPSGGAGITVTQQRLAWPAAGTITGLITAAPLGPSPWATLVSPTIPAGKHILTFDLAFSDRGTSWVGLEYQFQRTRNSVTTNILSRPIMRLNARGTAGKGDVPHHFSLHFETQAGDTFALRARATVDNNNLGTSLEFPAASQFMFLTTFA